MNQKIKKKTVGNKVWTLLDALVSDDFQFLLICILSIPWILILDPIMRLFTPPTPRFKKLRTLRLDALCNELIDGGDFDHFPRDDDANETELQTIAGHISEQAAIGALDQYAQRDLIFRKRLFWIRRNGHTHAQAQNGIRIGFYLALLIIILLWAFL